MPIKKCKYCETRMNKVVWGMTSQQDYESADEFTEFRGCVITSPTESWRCDFCDAKIIPSHTPKSGVCLEEAPRQLNNALEIFASRINQIADNHQELRAKLGHKYARLNSELPSFPSTSSLERQMI
jgi:hypothetical protein